MCVSAKLKDTHVSEKSTTEIRTQFFLSMTKSQAEILRKGSSPSHIVLGKGEELLFNLVLQFFRESLNKA